ncbi:MAG TPA: M20 family peptidase, partial [Candidatus Latescibacteria bacterium]|nr:M20 family peptidase [Candidatus Latescibacterota bacterium]
MGEGDTYLSDRWGRMGEPEVVALLRDLVATRTANPPGNELEGAEVLSAYLEGRGVPAEVDEFAPGRANLKAEVGDGSRTVLLTSHLDVVPPGREDLWTGDPFRLRREGGRLYGRGASDAKGSLAAMAVAVAGLAREGLPGRVRFAAVAGEEVDGMGSQRLVRQGFLGDGVVVGEPTGLRVMTAHKGRLKVTLEIPGKAAHASQPQEGVNPIPRAAEVVLRMEPLCREFSERVHPLLGPGSLVFTVARAGEKANMVPDSCILQMDARVVPPWTVEGAAEDIEAFVGRLSGELGFPISVGI